MTRPLHVLILAQYFPPDFGGASTRAYNAARGLVLQGCSVTVITSYPHYPQGIIPTEYRRKLYSRENMDGVRIIRTPIPAIPHSSNLRRILLHLSFMCSSLLGLFLVRKLDVIIAMNPNLFSVFPAFLYSLFFRKKIIRNVDDLWPEVFYDLGIIRNTLARRILDAISSLSYRIPVTIVPVSNGYTSILTTKYNIPLERIAVIEHGVDVAKFSSSPKDLPKNARKVVLYSGAITKGYDFEVVVKAAKLVNDKNIHFIIRGTGDAAGEVKDLIAKHNVRNIELRVGVLPKDELISLLRSADIFLLPMSPAGIIDEGLPTKILEYQAIGRPIVCISDGEAARFIKSSNTGIVTSRDPKVLAETVATLAENEELASRLGENASAYVRTHLTLEKIGMRFFQVISKALGNHEQQIHESNSC